MLSEEPKLSESAAEETDHNSGGPEAAPQIPSAPQTQVSSQPQPAPQSQSQGAQSPASASQPQRARDTQNARTAAAAKAEEEETRQSGDVDFGQLLDQFEQE
ncbi:MAG TPA: hypothetical protein VIV66_03640, partial [Pyrinomonadaceae bacterium]